MEKAFSAIITRKQFERVAKLMTSRAPKIANPRRVGSPFLLSGLVKCKTYRRDHRGFRPASVESPEGRSSWRQEPEVGQSLLPNNDRDRLGGRSRPYRRSDRGGSFTVASAPYGVKRSVKGGVIMYRRGGGERPGVALQNRTTRCLP